VTIEPGPSEVAPPGRRTFVQRPRTGLSTAPRMRADLHSALLQGRFRCFYRL